MIKTVQILGSIRLKMSFFPALDEAISPLSLPVWGRYMHTLALSAIAMAFVLPNCAPGFVN